MKSFLGWVKHRFPEILTYTVLLIATLAVFAYKQNSLIPGANIYEQRIEQKVDAYEYPWRQAVDAPYVTASWVASKAIFSHPIVGARLIAAVASTMSVLMFYHLLRNWLLSPGKALVGTALFATSSWTLALGRGAHAPVVGVFLMLLIFTFGTRLIFTTKPFLDWMLLVAAISLSLYTPLVAWFVFLLGAISLLHYRQRQRSLPLKLWQKIVVGMTAVVILTPLTIALIRDPSQGLELLGASSLVDSIPALLLNILEAGKGIFFIGSTVEPLGLGDLPMLDIFSVFMFLLGCYYFERRLALKRSKLLFVGLLLGLTVSSLSDYSFERYSLLLPIVYILISAGVHEAITRWLGVFPRNPVARSIGVIAISVAVGFVSLYHLQKVFIARPGNPQVRELYTIK